jgi:hypothetical protein
MLYLFIYAILFAISLRTYGFRRVNRTRYGRDVTVIYRNKNNSLEIEISRQLFSLRAEITLTELKDCGDGNVLLVTDNCYEAYDYRHAYRALDYMVLRGYSPELVPFDLEEEVDYASLLRSYGYRCIATRKIFGVKRNGRWCWNVARTYEHHGQRYVITENLDYTLLSRKVVCHSFKIHDTERGKRRLVPPGSPLLRPDQLEPAIEYFLKGQCLVEDIPEGICSGFLNGYLIKRYEEWFAGMKRKHARMSREFRATEKNKELLRGLQSRAHKLVTECETVTGFVLYAGLPSMILR